MGYPMSGSFARLKAIRAVTGYKAPNLTFSQVEKAGEVFGQNVFSRATV